MKETLFCDASMYTSA